MRYFSVALLRTVQTGTDPLGNPVCTLHPTKPAYLGRFTEWTAEEMQLVGRAVTESQRKLLTNAPLSACRQATAVRAGNEDYTIQTVKDLQGRWRLLYLERWRT